MVEDERGRRPKSTPTEVNLAAVAADLVENDRRIASRMIAESLNRLVQMRSALEIFYCCTIMHLPTKLQMFANV
jgi:hypothetical protein